MVRPDLRLRLGHAGAVTIECVALFRPGPLESGMVGDYIDRKHGRSTVSYPHPKLEDILRPTYGVILYQEQVMQIAQELAGFSLGDADLLRRAMGKKKASEMAEQRLVFVDGATARGLTNDNANFIFDQMETFAGYGFNKSHSAAYAVLSYHTAWLKTHYPAAFMAAVLSSDMDNTDKLAGFIHECRGMRLDLLPPDINASVYAFTMVDDASVRYGLGALKGLGRAAIEGIVAEREAQGDYTTLGNFCLRVDLQKVNRRALETLVRSGAMDALDPDRNRARMMQRLDSVLQAAGQVQHNRAAGQVDLFGNVAAPAPVPQDEDDDPQPPWTELQQLQAEKDALGLYLTGHPVAVHGPDLNRFTTCRLGELDGRVPESANQYRGGVSMVLAGMVGAQRRTTRRGRFITLEDHTGRLEVALFDEVYAQYAELLVAGEIVVVEGKVAVDDFSGGHRMSANKVQTLAEAKRRNARGVRISVQGPNETLGGDLEAAFAPYRGGEGQVWVDYRNQRARASLELSETWAVQPCEELVAALGQLDCVAEARLVY
jgi:DNA polymerase-3 subunit alpha